MEIWEQESRVSRDNDWKSRTYLPYIEFNGNTDFCLIHCHVYGQVNLESTWKFERNVVGRELKKGSRDCSSCMRPQL